MSPEGYHPILAALDLVGNAKLSFGFASGTGLGAMFLTIIAVVFLLRPTSSLEKLGSMLRIWKTPKE